MNSLLHCPQRVTSASKVHESIPVPFAPTSEMGNRTRGETSDIVAVARVKLRHDSLNQRVRNIANANRKHIAALEERENMGHASTSP